MKTEFRLLIALYLLPLSLFAQDRDRSVYADANDQVAWSPNRKLTWNDYKADPDPNSDAAASTTTYLGISYNIRSSDFSFKIECCFSKNESWGLHKNAYILSHEQGHFDIAEIFARKLYQRLLDYRFDKKTYRSDLKKIYQDILDEKKEMQDRYDQETNHSINRQRQMEWLNKIDEMLKDSEEYADYQNKP